MFTAAVLSLSWGQKNPTMRPCLKRKEGRKSGKICRISQGLCYCEKCLQYQIQWAFPFPLYGLNEHLILHVCLWLRYRRWELHSCTSWEFMLIMTAGKFKRLFLNYTLFSWISFRLEKAHVGQKKFWGQN